MRFILDYKTSTQIFTVSKVILSFISFICHVQVPGNIVNVLLSKVCTFNNFFVGFKKNSLCLLPTEQIKNPIPIIEKSIKDNSDEEDKCLLTKKNKKKLVDSIKQTVMID